MAEPAWESIKVTGAQVASRLKAILHEGNVRQVVVKQTGRTVAVFPLTVGLVGAVGAPVLAAVGALAALLTDCTIEVERAGTAPTSRRATKRRSPRQRD